MRRKDFWLKGFLVFLPIYVLSGILMALGTPGGVTNAVFYVGLIIMLLWLWPALALIIKRLHDRNLSGWFAATLLIPVVNAGFAIWMFIVVGFIKGTTGGNRFGEDPLAEEGAAVDKPVLSNDKRIVVSKFKTDGAAVKAGISAEILAHILKDESGRRIQKMGYAATESNDNGGTIDGSFIMIDEGNRFLRYMMFGLGSAKVQVEGAIRQGGTVLKEFDFIGKGRGGIFGGSGEKLLEVATRRVASDIGNLFHSL
jgi:uncharacterized membrane protein YhaH (DUF805 family)